MVRVYKVGSSLVFGVRGGVERIIVYYSRYTIYIYYFGGFELTKRKEDIKLIISIVCIIELGSLYIDKYQ